MIINDADWSFINSVHGLTSKGECDWIASLASRVSSWTEVGVYHGFSWLVAGLFLPQDSLLQAVDIRFAEQFWVAWKVLRKRRPDLNIIIAEGYDEWTAPLLQNTDVVFIDAGHDLNSVLKDIDAWKYRCKYLCGHDYNCIVSPFVKMAIDSRYKFYELRTHELIWYVDPKRELDFDLKQVKHCLTPP